MNSYTYMHNHKVLNDKSNETGNNNGNCRNKDTCSLPNRLTMVSLDINKNVALTYVKKHLKIVSGTIKSCSTTLTMK